MSLSSAARLTESAPPPVNNGALAGEDVAMIRLAATLGRELGAYRPAIYWVDTLASATLGWGRWRR